jgi:hypothetical protein
MSNDPGAKPFSGTIRFRSRVQAAVRGIAAAGLLLCAADAGAAVVVTDNASGTVYGTSFLGSPATQSGNAATITASGGIGGSAAEIGLKFTTTSSNSSFYFLQAQYCGGKCTTYALTTVTLTLTNTGTEAETMRFDSQITPGHLATIGNSPNAKAVFD